MTWKQRAAVSVTILSVGAGGWGCKSKNETPLNPTLTSVAVTGTSTVLVGQQTQLTARANMSDGSSANVSASAWASSDQAKATVAPSGLVTGVAVGSTNITATYQGMTSAAFPLTVAAGIADFTVTPDAGTGASAGQCPVSRPGVTATDLLKCTFDASISTSSAAITKYEWEIPQGKALFTGNPQKDVTIPCGDFADGDGIGTRDVKLTITTATGTASKTKAVTFVKAGAC